MIFWNSSFLVCKLVKGGEIRVVPMEPRALCLPPPHALSIEGPSNQLFPGPSLDDSVHRPGRCSLVIKTTPPRVTRRPA